MIHIDLNPLFNQLRQRFDEPEQNKMKLGLQNLNTDRREQTVIVSPVVRPSNDLRIDNNVANKIAQRQLMSTMENASAQQVLPYASKPDDDYSPEAVAGRLLSELEARLSVSGVDRDAVIGQFLAGIDQGFSEAQGTLEGLGAFGDDVAKNLTRTRQLVEAGVDRIRATGQQLENTSSASQIEHLSVEHSRQAAIEVRTQEGDIVTIEVSKSMSAEKTAYHALAANDQEMVAVRGVEQSRSAEVSLEFNVQGDLSEEEHDAIADLMKDMDKVAERFFNGNINAAFKQAHQLGFDNEQIAAFSFDLKQETHIQAVHAYQQSSGGQQGGQALAKAVDFMHELSGVRAQAQQTVLAEPEKDVAALFKEIFAMRGAEQDDDDREELSAEDALMMELLGQLQRQYNPSLDD